VLTSRPRRGGSLSSATLSGSDVADSSLAAAAILLGIERYLLAFDQVAHPRALKSGRMHKHVFSAVIRLNKTEAFLCIVELHSTRSHGFILMLNKCSRLDTEQSPGVEGRLSMFGRSERAPGNQRRRDGHVVRPNVDAWI